MNTIKKIIKKFVEKLFSDILREIKQVKDMQQELLNNNIELDRNMKELKSNDEIINRIDTLNNYAVKIERENIRLKNDMENISLILNRKNSIKKVRVAFLIHNVESWYTMQPIYELMLEDSVFDPILISVPRTYRHDNIFEDKSKDYLNKKYKKVISFENSEKIPDDIMYILNPDIIFRQSPWEDDIPEVFRTNNIKQFKICYIPYGIITIPINELHFNQSLHKYAWRLYCESEFHKQCYRKHNLIADSNAIVTGYTKFEQMSKILKYDSGNLTWPIKSGKKPSLRILWAPHHSLYDWVGFTTFQIIYKQMYDFALNDTNIEIVLRPHPALSNVMNDSGLIKKEELENYYKKFNELDNCYVDFSEEYINLFKYSDILVTDGVSFLFEYIMTGKPIIHTDSRKNVGFNEFAQQFEKSWYKAYSFDELKKYIYMIQKGDDSLLNERLALKEKFFSFSENDKPSKIIINDLKKSLLH